MTTSKRIVWMLVLFVSATSLVSSVLADGIAAAGPLQPAVGLGHKARLAIQGGPAGPGGLWTGS